MENKKKKKPEGEKLLKSVQVLLKLHEFKILNRFRSESVFATNASYVRAIILEKFKKNMQTELL
jgi:hypothetical protein